MVDFLLRMVGNLVRFAGRFKLPWTKQILTGDEMRTILDTAEPWDVIIVRTGGHFTSWILGKFFGGFSHAAMTVDWDTITDSTAKGVDTRDMLNVLTGVYRVAILRPTMDHLEKELMLDAYQWLKKLDADENIEYNYTLVANDIRIDGAPDKLQCSQYVSWLLNKGRPGFMVPQKRWGYESYTPNDFYNQIKTGKFKLIKEF